MLAIVDFGMGNVHSVAGAFDLLGAEAEVTGDPETIRLAERIVMPGVGTFSRCMQNLRRDGLAGLLLEEIRDRRKPFLGICLGLQMLADVGFEGGKTAGLGLIAGEVVPLEPDNPELRVPHVGWNDITIKNTIKKTSPLWKGIKDGTDFYFTHSYHFAPADDNVLAAVTDYGGPVTAAVMRDNVIATQFHPEKSLDAGLRFLENFLAWEPAVC